MNLTVGDVIRMYEQVENIRNSHTNEEFIQRFGCPLEEAPFQILYLEWGPWTPTAEEIAWGMELQKRLDNEEIKYEDS